MPTATIAGAPVEYETSGDGPAVLVLHGSPGGIDQARTMARFLPADLQAIVLSRPGYLGTPLGELGAIDAQADLYAALLDELGVERAAVLAWSGGGPSAYRFAVRHPGRVRSLVVTAGVSTAIERPEEDLPSRFMFRTRPGNWLLRVMAKRTPGPLIQSTLDAEGDLTKAQLEAATKAALADPDERRFVLDLAVTVSERGDRQAGLDNDWDRFAAIDELELERISAPVLLVGGSADTDVPPAHVEHAAQRIPRAQRLVLDAGTHLALWVHEQARDAQARAIAMLRG